jgi:hypothetical protein
MNLQRTKLSTAAERYEEHRQKVIATATCFRVNGFKGGGQWETVERSTRKAAERAGERIWMNLSNGRGVLMYAVSGPYAELVASYGGPGAGWREITKP